VVINNTHQPDAACVQAAKTLWEYLKLNQPLTPCDCIIAMGSHDLRVGEYAAQLALDNWAPVLVCSGGLGRLTRDQWQETEASKFARIARQMGVPFNKILVEDHSTNTGQNIQFSMEILGGEGCVIRKALLVHKPYMERRALATALKVWPGIDYCTSSPPIAFEDYPNCNISLDHLIHIMVGDFQRILIYPQKGFQIPQEIPENVLQAYQTLMKMGYTKFIISD
jgi:uncharacterized SAM-binding protein YcdF (DUF218 family)